MHQPFDISLSLSRFQITTLHEQTMKIQLALFVFQVLKPTFQCVSRWLLPVTRFRASQSVKRLVTTDRLNEHIKDGKW